MNVIQEWIGQQTPRQVVTANPEIVMSAQEDSLMAHVLRSADLVTPDGIGTVVAARMQGAPVKDRVTGIDLLPLLFETMERRGGGTVYLLGASLDSNEKALENLSLRYPTIRFVGQHGFFSEAEEPAILQKIRDSQPQLLLVGLGMPRQEIFIERYKQELQIPVSIGVGGCIDIFAGTVKRAPLLWRRLRLEWLYRLVSQPSRWRRQLVLPVFAWRVFANRFLSNGRRN